MTLYDSEPRKLTYPLRFSDTVIADTPNESVTYALNWPTPNPDERVNVTMQLSLNEYIVIASAVDAGRDIAYGDDSIQVWWLWSRALTALSKILENSLLSDNVLTGGISPHNEDNDTMCRFYTENINGNVALVEDCGCGNVRKFWLSPVTGSYGAVMGDSSGGFPSNSVNVSPFNLPCYGGKATDIVFTRMKDFSSRIIDVLTLGVDYFDPSIEIIDGVGELVDIIRNQNQYDSIQVLTKSEIDAAIDTYELTFSQQWAFDGPVERDTLKSFVASFFPVLEGAVPLRFIAVQWASFVNIRSLNAQLAIAAAECETANSLPPVLGPNAQNLDFGSFWLTKEYDISWSVNGAQVNPVIAFDMSGDFPGLVGFYCNVTGGVTDGNGVIQVSADLGSIFVNGIGQIIDWNSTLDIPYFRGGARIASWDGDATYDGAPDTDIDLAQIASGTYTMAFGHANTQFPALDATTRLVIDSAVQPYPGPV